MKNKISLVFTIILTVVMLGVLFLVMTNSRNSILIKEVFYVTGGSLLALFAAVLIFVKVPYYKARIPLLSVVAVVSILILMLLRHYFGIGSVNGPFTFFSLLSLVVLVLSSLLYIDLKHIKLLISVLLWSSFIMFIYSILQWQGINIFPWDAALTRSGRSTGSMGNPNLLGGFASALIPLVIAYFASFKKFSVIIRYFFSIGAVCLLIFAVIASGTRGSIIGVFAGTLFFLLWYLRKSKKSFVRLIPYIFGFVLIISVLVFPMRGRLSELDSSAQNQGTLQVRKIIWSGAFELFTQSPFWGHGPGSFQILFPEVRNPSYSLLGVSHNTLHAHCEYLEILVDIGLIGLALWAVVFWGLLPLLKNASLFQVAAFSGVIAMLAEALVSVHLRWPPTAWLFAMLFLIFMVKKDDAVKPGARSRIISLFFLLSSLVLVIGVLFYYIPFMSSSQLVFKGKDIYLAKTEMSMNSAYSAAQQWNNSGDDAARNAAINYWYSANVYADSAVYYSQEAVNTFSNDLGALYALGSAHLTRYMAMHPPVPAMQSVLSYSGISENYIQSDFLDELNAGMAAYEKLVQLAPNYAEVHNNLALGYSNLGMLQESMQELYYSFQIHAHRRDDYFNQVSGLLTIYPNSVDGALLYFSYILVTSGIEIGDTRFDEKKNDIINRACCLIALQPENADTLKIEFTDLVEKYLPVGERNDIINAIDSIEDFSPFYLWDTEAILNMNQEDALDELIKELQMTTYLGSTFTTILPDSRAFYTYPVSILNESGWNHEVYNKVLYAFLAQIQIDRELDDAFSLLYSERFQSAIDPDVRDRINAVRLAIGGSRAALREDVPMPWLEGSLPSLITDKLHANMVSDSLNSDWYEMELELTFLLVTSYWWDYNIFASEQNQYLLERIFYCRDMIRFLEPTRWQGIVSQLLDVEIERINLYVEGICPTTVGLLRDDLVGGEQRNLN